MTKNEMNRLIAERCEGLEAIDDQWVKHRDRGGEHGWHDRVRIDDYFTDIDACIRAAEAWVAQDPKARKWWLRRDGNISATVDQGAVSDGAVMDTPAASLAAALVGAVK